ncbi:SMP-30/gluconolactonase/LRE family protein (plasmid) [Sphingomonas paeninsulae]|uniref:SMP-30/gluconolactonase/LRE family protein n=1 Tax=Sphingomonas paeninsulae TaxID=2319844 RepID=A0A494TDD5_SPHPE|nr:SMP-30/gluconolactonase/LRE family protein [Sphingomonas paeninsulae]AYJ85302.1 SMP-30/gluconolactonase/LRE family protein [Sphingomonas paeninsulae]
MQFRTFAEGLSFAEGPIALSDGSLMCVEVLAGRLTAITRSGNLHLVAQLGRGPNGAAIGPDGQCYVANNGGLTREDLVCLAAHKDSDLNVPPSGCIQVVDLQTGSFAILYDHCDGVALIAPNDIVFDQNGGFYFTDYGSLRRAGPEPGRVYYATTDGRSIQDMGRDLQRPNGIGLSPRGDRLYVSETSRGRLWSFAIAEPGALCTSPDGASEIVFEDATLAMDSLAIQENGYICIACPHNDLVVRISPDGLLERFPTPAAGPSNICFGGDEMRTAYVTCLQSGVVLTADWDTPGLRLSHQRELGE